MAKYNALIEVKEGDENSPSNLLYASLSEIFDQEHVKISYTGDALHGELTQFARENIEKWRNGWVDADGWYHPGWNLADDGRALWTWENRIPIYTFTNAHRFNALVERYFQLRDRDITLRDLERYGPA